MKYIRNDVVSSIIINNKFIKCMYYSFDLNYRNRKLSSRRAEELSFYYKF